MSIHLERGGIVTKYVASSDREEKLSPGVCTQGRTNEGTVQVLYDRRQA